MFKNLFKRVHKDSDGNKSEPAINPAAEAMKKVIREKRKTDPLIGAKVGAKDLVQRLIGAMKTEKGVHIESLLSALGSIAGYTCQSSVREEFMHIHGQPENQVFAIASGADGKNYYFGDLLNKPLAESQYSVWSLAAGAAEQLGCKEFVDIKDIFTHVSQTVGSESFGIPRIPEDHAPGNYPLEYVKIFYPRLVPMLKEYCEKPSEWPILIGMTIQEVLYMSKGVIDPALALAIVMESAVPMSKIDLKIPEI
jgi:hypothetical protein